MSRTDLIGEILKLIGPASFSATSTEDEVSENVGAVTGTTLEKHAVDMVLPAQSCRDTGGPDGDCRGRGCFFFASKDEEVEGKSTR